MTAYAYLRKSSVHDPARELSFELQESAVRELAGRHGDADGLIVLTDWNLSGRLGADRRPGYRALLEAVESGQATAVYSYSLSRLARSTGELARFVELCVKLGTAIRLWADHVDTATASGRLLTHVLASVAEFEAAVASERVRAANAAKLARGESLATVKPYGAALGEDLEAVVAAWREAGSYSGAAKLLNVAGVKPRSSKRGCWWPSTVSLVVRRAVPGLAARPATRGYKTGGSAFMFARLLRCPTCSTWLTGTRDRDGRRVRYSCRLGTAVPHERVSISEHLVAPAIRAEVAHLRLPDSVVEQRRDAAKSAALEARRLRVLDMFERGDIARDDYARRLERIAGELAALEARRVVVAVPAVDWSWPPRELSVVLRALFESVTLDRGSFQPIAFEWKVPEWREPRGRPGASAHHRL